MDCQYGNIIDDELKINGKEPGPKERISDAKMPLSKTGIEQAKELANRLSKFVESEQIDKSKTLVLLSPYERVRQTFEIANEKVNFDNKHIYVLDSLREQNYGIFEYRTFDNLYELFPYSMIEFDRNSKYYRNNLLGESPVEISDRENQVLFFIKNYVEENEIKQIFIFGHANANRILTMKLLNLPPEYYEIFDCPENCSIMNIKDGKYNGFVGN